MIYIIPMIPPSLNKFAGRKNEWEYRKAKHDWKDIASAYCRPRPREPIENAMVTLTFFFPDKRRRDADNYLKLILDGIVHAGIIRDDSFDCIELTIRRRYDKENPRTEIEIEEIRS